LHCCCQAYIDLAYNQLTVVPKSIFQLHQLVALKLDHNHLLTLPAQVHEVCFWLGLAPAAWGGTHRPLCQAKVLMAHRGLTTHGNTGFRMPHKPMLSFNEQVGGVRLVPCAQIGLLVLHN
jgi:hypothetical protein